MGNADHWLVVKKGASAISEWQKEHPNTVLNLTWADLSRLDLSDADLSHADLRWANLSHVNLQGANLQNAKMTKANLQNANLEAADMTNADLSEAELKWANLCNANLTDSNLNEAQLIETLLRHANLSDASFSNAFLQGVDLSGAEGCVLSQEQQAKNAAGFSSPVLSKGYRTILISFVIFLGLLAVSVTADQLFIDQNSPDNLYMFVMMILTVGSLTLGFLIGAYQITRDKGYMGEIGLLLVLTLSFIGFLIVVLLPDKNKRRFY